MNTIEDGIHLLSGVESVVILSGNWQSEAFEGVALIIDEVTYVAYVDPSDGYRSYGSFFPSNVKIRNTFPAQRVIAENTEWEGDDEDGWHNSGSILTLTDCITNQPVLVVGTDTSDSYYPIAIFQYHPENMAINK